MPKDLEVNAGAGEVNILEFSADKAEFKCGAGSVTAAGDAKKKIDADCGVGEINLKLKGTRTIIIMIWTAVSERFSVAITVSQVSAERTVLTNGADKKMDIDCGIGSINVTFME